jgi:2-polyprenyl-3-methyl-5-hydroxy-6-metoxy-1,4-benzoquinol methylase
MTTTNTMNTDEFADHVFGALLGAQQIQALYLGDRLGWYATLASEGPMTSAELAHRTGTVERYAREWLEHQAVAGYVTADIGQASTRFGLPPEYAEVLVNGNSLSYLAPLARLMVATGNRTSELLEAYRSGGGVSWQQLGVDAREAQAYANRPMYLNQLAGEFLPQIPDLDHLLLSGARIADLGCGEGWSSIAMALGYPEVTVDGFDIDADSVAAANRNAADSGVADRVSVTAADVQSDVDADSYDAVFAFECVHDLSDPVAFLSMMGRIAKPGAPVIVMDERTAESFDPEAGAVEQLLYGFSVVCCLPDGMSGENSAATGTVMRHSTLDGYARSAGFAGATVLDIEHEIFRFYRLQ